jgi:LysR family transcriptional activator of mexEF-oprN operon
MTDTLRSLDLNLLAVFATLMQERSVTRAGERLGLSQPATSGALARLRETFRDPLFIRTGRSFEPTARALALMERLGPAMAALAEAVAPAIPFDPAIDRRDFRIACQDDIAIPLLPRLMPVLATEAPLCTLTVRRGDWKTIPAQLEKAEVSAALGYMADDLPANAKRRTVVNGHFVVLRADSDPAPIPLDTYCARPHVLVTPAGDLRGRADLSLEALGRSRRVVLGLTDFALLPSVLAGTDLVATVPDFVAETLAAQGGLRIDPTPFEPPPAVITMAWRGAADGDPAERWLRGRIVAELRGTP